MIYRIHHNDKFLTFEIPTREVVNKLGREYPFHINRAPIAYKPVWKALQITFQAAEKNTLDIIPDLAEVDGRLFLSEKAFDILKDFLEGTGEFLPVTYDGGTGYIFNILNIAEDRNALNEKLTVYDQYNNLSHFEFKENELAGSTIFRAEIDNYSGIFCNDILKSKIENSKLTGVYMQTDLANVLGCSNANQFSH